MAEATSQSTATALLLQSYLSVSMAPHSIYQSNYVLPQAGLLTAHCFFLVTLAFFLFYVHQKVHSFFPYATEKMEMQIAFHCTLYKHLCEVTLRFFSSLNNHSLCNLSNIRHSYHFCASLFWPLKSSYKSKKGGGRDKRIASVFQGGFFQTNIIALFQHQLQYSLFTFDINFGANW